MRDFCKALAIIAAVIGVICVASYYADKTLDRPLVAPSLSAFNVDTNKGIPIKVVESTRPSDEVGDVISEVQVGEGDHPLTIRIIYSYAKLSQLRISEVRYAENGSPLVPQPAAASQEKECAVVLLSPDRALIVQQCGADEYRFVVSESMRLTSLSLAVAENGRNALGIEMRARSDADYPRMISDIGLSLPLTFPLAS